MLNMRKGDNFITTVLILIIIGLMGLIGFVGYSIYNEMLGNENTILNFIGEAIYPSMSNNEIKEENTIIEPSIFEGLEQENPENGTIQNRNLYNQLSPDAKKIYAKLYSEKENLKTGTYVVEFGNTFEEILSQEGGSDELQRQYQSAVEALIYENPEIFYLDVTHMWLNIETITRIARTKYNVYINSGKEPNYLSEGFYSKEDIERHEEEIQQVVNQILPTLEGKSDYDKIKIVHDYLVDTIEYESTLSEDNVYNIYGALVLKKCVCEGYAKAFQYLMNQAGIENVIVIGTGTNSKGDSENHAWNYVKLNEKWYAVDVTWDDPIIIGGGKLNQQLKYKYFLVGATTFYKSHVESTTFTEGGQTFSYPTLSLNDYK